MDGVVLAGRILIASIFVFSGATKFADLSGVAEMIGSKGLPMPMVLAGLTAALEVLGGIAIIVGWQTRYAAWMLAAFTFAAGALFHDFWNYPEGQEAMMQMQGFTKNIAITGGFLMLAAFGPGRFALDARRHGRTYPTDGLGAA